MPMCLLHLSLLLVLIYQASTCNSQEIELDNNGYVGIVVAIDSQEDWNIVSNIQEHFTDASRFLYRATLYRAYFKEITILVPTSWNTNTRFELSPATNESFLDAKIRIADSNSAQPNNPYVRKYTGCGLEGEFMHLTAKYVLDGETQKRYGDVGKTIVHEWGHLRYGLFDEYDTGKSSGTKENPVKCGLNLKGTCDQSISNTAAEETCTFMPEEYQVVTASIMYKQSLQSVQDFCDNQGIYETEHNMYARNMQNTLCRYQSCWEVMRSHRDFKDGNNPPNEKTLNTTPTFKLVQAVVERIVLVIDTSGSMGSVLSPSTLTRLDAMVNYITDFIQNSVPDGTHMGIVSFDTSAKIDNHVVHVDDASKQKLISSLPSKAQGGTCIGCGLEKGIEALNQTGSPTGGILLLISDGEENVEPYISSQTAELTDKYIRVYTLLFTDGAGNKLRDLANVTKGRSYYVSGDPMDLNAQRFFASVLQQALTTSHTSATAVSVKLAALVIPASGSANTTFIIDDTLGIDTLVTTLYQTSRQEFDMMLISPNGTAYHAPSRNIASTSTIQIHIPHLAETGEWQILLYNSTSPQIVQLHVTSRQRTSSGATFSVNGYLSQNQVNGMVVADPTADMASRTLVVTGGVFFGYAPVLGATVTMVVQKGDMEWTRLLHDDGVGADTLPGDGFYSAYFQEFDGDGKYSVTILASAEVNQSYYRVTDYASGSAPVDPQYAANETAYDVFLSPFERFISSGFVTLYNYDAMKRAGDVFPPSRVMDLSIQIINESTAALTWTAVGDDLEQGTAALYDMRYCLSIPEALQSFEFCMPIIGDNITSYVAPSSASSLERYLWQVPDEALNRTLVLGLRVQDDAGLWSDTSNLISVTMSMGPEATDSTETVADVTTSISATESHQDTDSTKTEADVTTSISATESHQDIDSTETEADVTTSIISATEGHQDTDSTETEADVTTSISATENHQDTDSTETEADVTTSIISATESHQDTDSTETEADVTTSISATESHQDTEQERQKLIIIVVPLVTAVVFILVVTFFTCLACSNRRPAKPSSKEERAVEAGRHAQSGSAFALF